MAISPKVVEMSVEDVVASPAVSNAFLERNPSNWNIVELEDGTIEASCSNSRESFSGSIEDFNLRLRG